MSKEIFKEPLDNNFFSNNFGRKYIHKREFLNEANSVVSLEILDDMLSKSNDMSLLDFLISDLIIELNLSVS